MHVTANVAIRAVHAGFLVNIFEVNGLFELLRIVGFDLRPARGHEIPLAIGPVNVPEYPAMAVEVAELRACGFRIDVVPDVDEEVPTLPPFSAQCRSFRIAELNIVLLFIAEFRLFFGVHQSAVGLVIPPSHPVITRQHVPAGMNVADHALA